MRIDSPEKLKKWKEDCLKGKAQFRQSVVVCFGPGCLASGCREVYARFEELLGEKNIHDLTLKAVKKTGCHGLCEKGPLVVIEPEGIFYTKVKPEHVPEIIEKTIGQGEVIERLLYEDLEAKQKIKKYQDIDFYKRQTRIALRNLGHIDPDKIEDYISTEGYTLRPPKY